jgi:hypothetical protein
MSNFIGFLLVFALMGLILIDFILAIKVIALLFCVIVLINLIFEG